MMQEMVIVDRFGERHWARRRFAICRAGCDACGGRRRFCTSRKHARLATAVSVVARNRYRLSGGPKCDEGTCTLHR